MTEPNPFHQLRDLVAWGGVTMHLKGGRDACVCCGDPQATPHTIVPPALLPDADAYARDNNMPLCAACVRRLELAPRETYLLAAALLLRRCPPIVESLPLPIPHSLGRDGLRDRDGWKCTLCGLKSTHRKRFHNGHIISRFDGRDRTDSLNWGMPYTLLESPLNYVLLCVRCNEDIGGASPSLRVGLRFLVKPWTDDPYGTRIHEERYAEAQKRAAERKAARARARPTETPTAAKPTRITVSPLVSPLITPTYLA